MSGKICAVVNCHSSYRFLKVWTKTRCHEHVDQLHEDCPCLQPFSFRRFPKNPELRKEWLRVINRKDFLPTDNSVVCSKHFVDGNRIPQLEMGYEKKVVVGHHHFAKNLAPLHKKRKTHNHNTWNGNHIGRTLDHLHTIMQLKKQEEDNSLVLTRDAESEAARRRLKSERRHRRQQQQQQQTPVGVQPPLPDPPSDEVSRFLSSLDLELSESLLLDRAAILDPLLFDDDTSRCSFYGRALAMGDSLELSPELLDCQVTPGDGDGACLPSSFARAMSSLEAAMSEAGPRGAGGGVAGPPWLEGGEEEAPPYAPSTSGWCRIRDEGPPIDVAPETRGPPPLLHNNNNNDDDESEPSQRRHRSTNHAARPAVAKTLSCKICGERFQCSDAFRSHLLKHMADSDKSYVL